MWRHDTDYPMMPPVLWSNLDVPWDLHREEYPKLWRNSIYTTWKADSPGEEVGLAMTFIYTNHREFDYGRLVLDISDGAAIRYLASKVEDDDDGDESTGDAVEDDNDEDDNLDEDLHKTATDIANKMDDSGFRSSAEDNSKIEPLSRPGTTWMGKVPSHALRAPAVGSWSSMRMASRSEEVTGASFDAFINAHAEGSGIGELMGGQALLQDYTTVAELKQLCELANEQVKIARCFNAKFSDMAFALLEKIHEVFIGTGGRVQKFVDEMATAALNFIRYATTYEAELSASDGMAFTAGLTRIWEQIVALIREASALELMYKGAQKKFADILEWVGKEVKEYLDAQSTVDCTTFMDESFKSLHKFWDTFNVSPFIPVVVGTYIAHHLLLTSLQVNVLHFLSPFTSDAMAVLGQMALLNYMAQQGITVQEGQAPSKPIPRTSTGEMDPTLKSDHESNVGLIPQKLKLDKVG